MPRPGRRHEARPRGPGRSPVPSPRTTDTPVIGAGPGAARQSPPVRISARPWKGHSPCRRPERTSMDSSPSASAVTPASAPRPETAAGDTRRPLTDNVPGGASRPRHVQRHCARPRRTRAARTARGPTPGQGQLPAGVRRPGRDVALPRPVEPPVADVLVEERVRWRNRPQGRRCSSLRRNAAHSILHGERSPCRGSGCRCGLPCPERRRRAGGGGRAPAAVPAGAVTVCRPENIGVPGGRDAHRRPGTASALRVPSAQPEEPRSP